MILICLAFIATGCGNTEQAKIKKVNQAQIDYINSLRVNDEDLAKMILKPKKETIDVSRDPFTPLGQQFNQPLQQVVVAEDDAAREIKKYKFEGVAKMGEEYIAFLQSGKNKGAFRIKDDVIGFKIKNINENEITLTNGEEIVTLRRSERGGPDEKTN